MVDRLYCSNDIAARYDCSITTARAYMRKMRHTEKPLRVRERDLLMWEEARTVDPAEKKKTKQKRSAVTTSSIQRAADGKYHLSRTR